MAGGTEIGFADLIANTLVNQSAEMESKKRSERIKLGKRASKAGGPKKRSSPKK